MSTKAAARARLVITLLALVSTGSVTAKRDSSQDGGPRAGFVTVRGVRLHYVDWGGTGEPLLFLTANGGRPERQFDLLAPSFVDTFHVLGLTRRGQGESDKPKSGYHTDSLASDIAAFLDALVSSDRR